MVARLGRGGIIHNLRWIEREMVWWVLDGLSLTVQLSSVHFDLITQECCISNTEEVFMQVLGPIIVGDGDDIITELA